MVTNAAFLRLAEMTLKSLPLYRLCGDNDDISLRDFTDQLKGMAYD